jgi:hypothetical protein
MKQTYTKFSDPWEHIILERRFSRDQLRIIRIELIAWLMDNYDLLNENQMLAVDDLTSWSKTQRIVESNPITVDWIGHFSQHRDYESLRTRNQVIFAKPGLNYRIHDESAQKVLSSTTYISEQGIGTHLYHNQFEPRVKTVEWIPGNTLIFCGMDGVTWHNYQSDNLRITLNTFLER